MGNGKVVNTVTTIGTADQLGIKNIEKLVEMGNHFLIIFYRKGNNFIINYKYEYKNKKNW